MSTYHFEVNIFSAICNGDSQHIICTWLGSVCSMLNFPISSPVSLVLENLLSGLACLNMLMKAPKKKEIMFLKLT